jgi:hypothetical protein
MEKVTTKITRLPAFRFGESYDSLTQSDITTPDGSRTLAKVGYVNSGIIRRDLRKVGDCFEHLQQISISDMLTICADAARLFKEAELPVCEGLTQSPDDYVRILSATCGLPFTLIHENIEKITNVMVKMPLILKGLTRGLDLTAIETGIGRQNEVLVSYYPKAKHLGIILPSNSPGVNSLWLPAVALRIPVIIKPGREDPWTPWRLINALLTAGCPAEAFGFYPADHDSAAVILSECERVIIFGDSRTVEQYVGDPLVGVHGPGYSKILIGDDCIDRWEDYIELMADSVVSNGGRSCINASTIVVPRYGEQIAEALAERLAAITPQPLDSPSARLAGFSNKNVPASIDKVIEEALAQPGASDISALKRAGGRLIELNGQTYLQPTVVYCSDEQHGLAKTEFLFPFTSVVEMPQSKMLKWIGPSLVVSAITEEDESFRRSLLGSPDIKRLNLGPVPTVQVSWDQPHEGNLFEFLYERRAIQEKVK